MPSGHTFWKAGDQPCRILEIISAANFEKYFDEMGDAGARGPLDLEALSERAARYGLEVDPGSIAGRFGLRFGPRRLGWTNAEYLRRLGVVDELESDGRPGQLAGASVRLFRLPSRTAKSNDGRSRMSEHDVLCGFRLRLFTLAEELGNVSGACRLMGVHRSTYYRLKRQVDRWGLEALKVRERRRPRMPNEIGPHLQQRIIAFSLAHPGFGPPRIAAELAREKWGGLRISEHGVWRVLCRVGLNTRGKRLALVARHHDPYERRPSPPPPARHIDATEPGEVVPRTRRPCARAPPRSALDVVACPARLLLHRAPAGTKGSVWQYSAIDVASGYAWAELHSSPRNPRSRHCQTLLHRLAHELSLAGWKLQRITTDNGSEFRAKDFGAAAEGLGARQRFIRAGRPTSNGCVERLQLTILEECWRPSFARSLVPQLTALQKDRDHYLDYYNTDRAHTGRLTRGRVPADIVYGAAKMGARP